MSEDIYKVVWKENLLEAAKENKNSKMLFMQTDRALATLQT